MFDRCPHAWLRDEAAIESHLVLDVIAFQRDGILPDAGGRVDQSPRFAETVDVVTHQRLIIEQNDSAAVQRAGA